MYHSDFSRAHEMWLSPIENSPEYDEWLDAQDEKKSIISRFNDETDSDVQNIDEMDKEIAARYYIIPTSIQEMRDQLARLEDDFPMNYPEGEW